MDEKIATYYFPGANTDEALTGLPRAILMNFIEDPFFRLEGVKHMRFHRNNLFHMKKLLVEDFFKHLFPQK